MNSGQPSHKTSRTEERLRTETSHIEGAPAAPHRFSLLDLPIDPIRKDDLLSYIVRSIDNRAELTVASVNLHGLYCALRTPNMRALWSDKRTIVHIDGMPIVWIAKAMGQPVTRSSRLGHIDLLPSLFRELAKRQKRVLYVGSEKHTLQAGMAKIRHLEPELNIRCYDGYFDLNDRRPGSPQSTILDAIRDWRPDLLLVGMGMPRQEEWIRQVRDEIDVPVVMPCGGFFDLLSGEQPIIPRWVGQIGFEGVIRLIRSPRRLSFRYCIEPLWIITYALSRWARSYQEDRRKRTLGAPQAREQGGLQ
jgi:N-acetylglucosaminyldiphosphoundecaprenol N-acetyl-beta-D-mannosaminyltransferase